MNCLSHVASYSAAILRGTHNFIGRSNLHYQSYYNPLKINYGYLGNKSVNLEFLVTRFRLQCYSSSAKKPRSRKLKTEPQMKQGKDEFFVVRKGDLVGVYKSFTECQAQLGSSVILLFSFHFFHHGL